MAVKILIEIGRGVWYNIRREIIGQFIICNPEMPQENLGDKFCRLDINMTVSGQRVDLEVQVGNEGDYPERVMYYWAREFSSALLCSRRKRKRNWKRLKRWRCQL